MVGIKGRSLFNLAAYASKAAASPLFLHENTPLVFHHFAETFMSGIQMTEAWKVSCSIFWNWSGSDAELAHWRPPRDVYFKILQGWGLGLRHSPVWGLTKKNKEMHNPSILMWQVSWSKSRNHLKIFRRSKYNNVECRNLQKALWKSRKAVLLLVGLWACIWDSSRWTGNQIKMLLP